MIRTGLVYIAETISVCAVALMALSGHAATQTPLDRGEVEAWADAYYGRAVDERRSAGIIVSVVQDGEIVLSKGYGFSHYANQTPANPETSGFVIGSITKTFIATAIAQLVDRGVIASLDDSANVYLTRVKLPGERGAKVSIRHLLNHRAGFEDVDFGFLDRAGASVPIPIPSEEILRFMPEIVMEPGGRANYSNWGFSMLGFLIEDVTGRRLDDYLKENIFDPLGMAHTSLIYGVFPDNYSINFTFEKDGTPVERSATLPHPWIAAAGTMVSTASDIARYMNAHLFAGENGGYSLVSKSMFKALHTEQYRNSAIGHGFSLAFWTGELNGAKTIEHGGGAPGYQSMMTMIPQQRIGFFVSALQGGLAPWASYSKVEIEAGEILVRDPPSGFELRESFVERFFETGANFQEGSKSDLGKLTGQYWTQKRPFTTLEKLGQGFNPAAVLTVALSDDGNGLMLSGAGPYREIGAGVFMSPSGAREWNDPYAVNRFLPTHVAFNLDENGEVIDFAPGFSDQVYVLASSIFNPPTMLLGFLLFGLITATGVFMFVWPQRARFLSLTNYLCVAAFVLVAVFPYAILGGFEKGDSLIGQMATGDKGRFWVMVIAANVLLVTTSLLLALVARTWFRASYDDTMSWGRKLHLSIVALSCLAIVIVLKFFNLLGINMPG